MAVIKLNGSCFEESFKSFEPTNPHQHLDKIAKCFVIDSDKVQRAKLAKAQSQPYILFKQAFTVNQLPDTPTTFEPLLSNQWWLGANTAIALANAMNMKLYSYKSENNGSSFVNLVRVKNSSIRDKSDKSMRGHTDAAAHPLPDEYQRYPNVSPSPDFVVLICLRNQSTATKIAPLSKVVQYLDEDDLEQLQEQQFIVRPQGTFKMENWMLSNVKIISHNSLAIRYSHQNVSLDNIYDKQFNDNQGTVANTALKVAIEKSMQDLVLEPGDIAFVNNRTAIHGRSKPHPDDDGQGRWLMRTYGIMDETKVYPESQDKPYLLVP